MELAFGDWMIIATILVLICCSGFFSGSETALTAASKARMLQLEKNGDARAGIVGKLIVARERLIGAMLLGNNLVNILASALATSLFTKLFGDAGVAYATMVMTLLVLIFAEMLPKSLAISDPDAFARFVSPVVRVVVGIFSPAVQLAEKVVKFVLRSVGLIAAANAGVVSAHEEIRGTVDLQHMEGGLVKDDRDRLGGILDLHELSVYEVMVHRTKMQTLDASAPPDEIVEAALKSPFTRLPIWQGEPENIVGILHAKDLLRALQKEGGKADNLDVVKIATPPWYVPDSTMLRDQLNAFLRRKSHFALVVDEYGEVMGLITLEDILEEIVGEIADEHDPEVEGVRHQPDGSLLIDGSVPIRDLNRGLEWELPDEEATTIAGLVIHEARMIPDERQAFTFYGFRFTVLRKQGNRLTLMKVDKLTDVDYDTVSQ